MLTNAAHAWVCAADGPGGFMAWKDLAAIAQGWLIGRTRKHTDSASENQNAAGSREEAPVALVSETAVEPDNDAEWSSRDGEPQYLPFVDFHVHASATSGLPEPTVAEVNWHRSLLLRYPDGQSGASVKTERSEHGDPFLDDGDEPIRQKNENNVRAAEMIRCVLGEDGTGLAALLATGDARGRAMVVLHDKWTLDDEEWANQNPEHAVAMHEICESPLTAAVRAGRMEFVNAILPHSEMAPAPDEVFEPTSFDQRALTVAVESKNSVIAEALFKAAAPIRPFVAIELVRAAVFTRDVPLLNWVVDRACESLPAKHKAAALGYGLLHAVELGLPAAAQALVNLGANPAMDEGHAFWVAVDRAQGQRPLPAGFPTTDPELSPQEIRAARNAAQACVDLMLPAIDIDAVAHERFITPYHPRGEINFLDAPHIQYLDARILPHCAIETQCELASKKPEAFPQTMARIEATILAEEVRRATPQELAEAAARVKARASVMDEGLSAGDVSSANRATAAASSVARATAPSRAASRRL